MKRGLDTELCAIAGMLHDISCYETGNIIEHAKFSAQSAKKILKKLNQFTEKEIEMICEMISHHSAKRKNHASYSELLKDADVLQHYLYNTSFEVKEKEQERLSAILSELGNNK